MNSDIKRATADLGTRLEKNPGDVEAGFDQIQTSQSSTTSRPPQKSTAKRVIGYFILLAVASFVYRTIPEYNLSVLWGASETQYRGEIEYSAVPGFFKQSIWGANATELGPTPKRFGLIDGHKKYWRTFRQKIKKLNHKSGKHTTYKVLFLGRHGEGYHNLGLNYYGEDEWDRKWGRLTGNGTITWGPDAKLTPNGIKQAERVNALWKNEMENGGGIPLPTALFVSPLRRALYTFNYTFDGVVESRTPLIVENLRDAYGLRTSDWRHNKTWIHERFPRYEFEEGFTESDELWQEGKREPTEHVQKRVKGVLDKLFSLSDTYLALVAHDKVLSATFNLTGHPDYDVPTGALRALMTEYDMIVFKATASEGPGRIGVGGAI
ncbi:hypothetical protein FRB90_002240 [Tulasnella sp. 427]|nr:hypothetical protein FRB90_002240 [Tulasnella sp. 427]